ncbi:MAG: peptidoglycan-binding protein [Bacteroidota bacterium]|nr:peptidoglycan-binding protein [Bacteroidota bacterium]
MALVKLKIEAFTDPNCTTSTGNSVVAMFNPDTYSRNYKVEYHKSEVIGENDTTLIFKGMPGSDMNLKLIADGTGVVPLPQGITNVDGYIQKVKDVACSFHGPNHRPNFLKVMWGSLSFICVCTSFKVNYSLFKEDGSALRATIELNLSQTIDFKTKAKEAQKQSPDLTHMRTVKAGDTLPLMTYRIYGDSAYYMEVARINQLKSVHAIKPGDQIYFPPIKK